MVDSDFRELFGSTVGLVVDIELVLSLDTVATVSVFNTSSLCLSNDDKHSECVSSCSQTVVDLFVSLKVRGCIGDKSLFCVYALSDCKCIALSHDWDNMIFLDAVLSDSRFFVDSCFAVVDSAVVEVSSVIVFSFLSGAVLSCLFYFERVTSSEK